MIYFKDYLYDGGPMRFYIDEPGKERKFFYVEKTNDVNSFPTIDPGFSFDIAEGYIVLKKIMEIGNFKSPVGNINVSNGFYIYFNGSLIPIIKETLLDKDKFQITALSLFCVNVYSKENKYLDYYYTNLNINKLKEIKISKKIDRLSFCGFDNSGDMNFIYENNNMHKRFLIKQFCGTTHKSVYVPRINFEESASIEEIKEIIKYLFEIKYLDFGEEIGKIHFRQVIIESGNEKYVPVMESTKEKTEIIFEMVDKEFKNRDNKSRWLKR